MYQLGVICTNIGAQCSCNTGLYVYRCQLESAGVLVVDSDREVLVCIHEQGTFTLVNVCTGTFQEALAPSQPYSDLLTRTKSMSLKTNVVFIT